MLCSLFAATLLTSADQEFQQKDLRILFLGNSHTVQNNIPATVESLLETDGSRRKVTVSTISGGFLRTIYQSGSTSSRIAKGNWDYVVLQGQEISSSHKYDYSKEEAIELARLARRSGAKPLMFAEWSRKGIDESDYIYNIYNYIAIQSGAEVIPICYSFDQALSTNKRLSLWAADGNHASSQGSLLAAITIYYWINGTDTNPTNQKGRNVATSIQAQLRTAAKKTVKSSRKK